MKILKHILFYAAVAAAGLSLASCQEEIPAGPLDPEGCYGVYFPEQTLPGEQDPTDPKRITLTARRTRTEGTIGVPVRITDTNGVFKVQDIVFADGESETTFTVQYPNVKIGHSYPCNIRISDPEYYSKYSNNNVELDFTVTLVKWNDLTEDKGYARYRDGIMANAFELAPQETKCEIFERDDRPGYFRLHNVYTPEFINKIMGDDQNYTGAVFQHDIYIDATDPEKVWLDAQKIGVNWPPYGRFIICSNVSKVELAVATLGTPEEIYGTYDKKTGIISFPSHSLLFGFEGELMGFIENDFTRIVMPGFKAFDYSITLKTGLTENNAIPATFTLAADVHEVRYAVFDGKLNEFEAETKASQLGAEGSDVEFETITKKGTYNIKPEKTGEYTIVAASFDKEGKYRSFAYSVCRYLKDGDDSKDVVLDVKFFKSDKFVSEGLTTENSLMIYLSGSDIEDIKVGIFRSKDIDAERDTCIAKLKRSPSMPAEALEMINSYNYSGAQPYLAPGAEYSLLVYASNGYATKIVEARESTDGTYSDVYTMWKQKDLVDETHKASDFLGTWNYYAVNRYDENPQRQYIGKVNVTESDLENPSPEEFTILDFSDLFAPISGIETFTRDTSHFIYHKGFVKTAMNEYGPFEFLGYEVSCISFNTMPDGSFDMQGTGYLLGGFVKDGMVAFVPTKVDDVLYDAVTVFGFADPNYHRPLGTVAYVSDMLLVDPAKDDSNLAEPDKEVVRLNQLQRQLNSSASRNYVQTEEGIFKDAVDRLIYDEIHGNLFNLSTFVVADTVDAHEAVAFTAGYAGEKPADGVRNLTIKRIW